MTLKGRSVLVSGGTGSFGTAFIGRALALEDPAKVIVYSRDEVKQRECRRRWDDTRLRVMLGDVRDVETLTSAMCGVSVVVHAAALKQVDALEYAPFEAIATNVLGTQNVIRAAIAAGVERVVLISSDKAVNPLNLYGATKLLAERLIVAANSYASGSATRLSAVRYGNVMGSRGSVLSLWEDQAQRGDPLTLTHPEMTRFLITLEHAVSFVMESLADMKGGEVFVPKLPATTVGALADVLHPGVPTTVVGLRPGEKMHELLIAEGERAVEQEGRYVVLPQVVHFDRGVTEGVPFVGALSSRDVERLDAEGIRELLGVACGDTDTCDPARCDCGRYRRGDRGLKVRLPD